MSAVPTDPALQAYRAAVVDALADLPPDDRAELLGDVDEHLAEILGEEPEVSLVERLGSPASYAAELRTAAGVPPSTEPASRLRHRLARLAPARAARRAARALAARAEYQQVVSFLPELRPGWWVLRGYLVVLIPCLWDANGSSDFPWPKPLGSGVLGVVLLAVSIPLSVAWGRRTQPAGRARVATTVANLTLGVLAFVLSMSGRFDSGVAFYDTVANNPTLTGPMGTITNIYPYAPDGRPLDGVLLYDQYGRPIDYVERYCTNDPLGLESGVPQCPAVGNLFPYPASSDQPRPKIAPLLPTGTPHGPAPTPTGTPAPTLTPTPGASRSS